MAPTLGAVSPAFYCLFMFFFYLFSSSTSNGVEVRPKNILAEWPTEG